MNYVKKVLVKVDLGLGSEVENFYERREGESRLRTHLPMSAYRDSLRLVLWTRESVRRARPGQTPHRGPGRGGHLVPSTPPQKPPTDEVPRHGQGGPFEVWCVVSYTYSQR